MTDPKDEKDPKELKDLNQQDPSDKQATPEKAELSDEDLEKLSGGDIGGAGGWSHPCI
jgi:hypothetical protein